MLLVGAFFAEHKAQAMFFISTITVFMALPIARLLTVTVLKDREEAPFIMEMPPYHLPTIRGVLSRALERVMLFAQKIVTIVAAIAVIVFVLLQFPGLSKEQLAERRAQADAAVARFRAVAEPTRFAPVLAGDGALQLARFEEDYKAARQGVTDADRAKAVDALFQTRSEAFFRILKPKGDAEAKPVAAAWKELSAERQGLVSAMKKERLDQSFLGMLGRALEPVTVLAGFNWRVNAGLLSAFAAKESAVANYGRRIYLQQAEGDEAQSLEASMRAAESDFTPFARPGAHALHGPLSALHRHGHGGQGPSRRRQVDAFRHNLPHVPGVFRRQPGLHRRLAPGLRRAFRPCGASTAWPWPPPWSRAFSGSSAVPSRASRSIPSDGLTPTPSA